MPTTRSKTVIERMTGLIIMLYKGIDYPNSQCYPQCHERAWYQLQLLAKNPRIVDLDKKSSCLHKALIDGTERR